MGWRLLGCALVGVLLGVALVARPLPADAPVRPASAAALPAPTAPAAPSATDTPAPAAHAPSPAPDTASRAPDPAPAPTAAPPAPPKPRATAPTTPTRPAPAAASPAPADRTTRRLQFRLERTLDDVLGDRDPEGLVALVVLDEDGRSIYAHNPQARMLPASTQKLLTAAAALRRYSPDHRYTTTVRATGPPDQRGVIRGDLVLIGGADATLATRRYAGLAQDRPRAALTDLARQVRRAGIRHVTGRVLANPAVLAPRPLAEGWPRRYLRSMDAALSSGLTVDGGQRVYERDGYLRAETARNPARQAARALHDALRVRGVRVDGGVGSTRDRSGSVAIASVRGPTLEQQLRHVVQDSDNHMADTIFRSLAIGRDATTWAGAARTVRRQLTAAGVDHRGHIADGSGLSRANRVTPAVLARLQALQWDGPEGARWRSLLAVAGDSGTLAHRLQGTVADGLVYGKTGTLNDVRALVATVVGPQGRHVHVAFIANDVPDAADARVLALSDRIVRIAAETLYGCRAQRRLVCATPPTPR